MEWSRNAELINLRGVDYNSWLYIPEGSSVGLSDYVLMISEAQKNMFRD